LYRLNFFEDEKRNQLTYGEIYSGPIDCAKKIYQINGVPGLFKGMVPTILREIPAYASFYGVFEFMKRRLTPEGKSVKDLPLYSLMFAGSCGGM
jgi:solute carrier family 25 carnitine/acylcarnitine transporter 20/29